jgi:hypothetical protein
MPITLRGVRSVGGGSIEAIRWPWRSTGGCCPIPCKTPEPHGPMRTMEVRTRTRIRSRAEVRGPAGGFGFAWRDLSLPSRRQGLIATRPPSNILRMGSFLFARGIAAKISGLSRDPDRRPNLPCIKFWCRQQQTSAGEQPNIAPQSAGERSSTWAERQGRPHI